MHRDEAGRTFLRDESQEEVPEVAGGYTVGPDFRFRAPATLESRRVGQQIELQDRDTDPRDDRIPVCRDPLRQKRPGERPVCEHAYHWANLRRDSLRPRLAPAPVRTPEIGEEGGYMAWR